MIPEGMWIYDDSPQPWWKRVLYKLHLKKPFLVYVDFTKGEIQNVKPFTITFDERGYFTMREDRDV